MLLFAILIVPLVLAGIAAGARDMRSIGRVNALGHTLVFLCALLFARELAIGTPRSFLNFFFADALSGFFVLTTALIGCAAAVYSLSFIDGELAENRITPGRAKRYYVLFNVFAVTMFMVTVLNNLGFVWVAIEMTTLVSAFLVGFHNDKKSVEAAWKYLILCSVGITFALLGTILFYYTLSVNAGVKTLNWTDMIASVARLDSNVLKIGFLFILVGYGTKAGLAPMHTWLPDAHSQAPAPISAMLSGILLNTALYAIMRFMVIVNAVVGKQFAGELLIVFGLISVGVSAGFILVQKDLKRLLAYSSIEHIGIIAIGLGIGGPLGYFGALFHVFNHGVTKAMMFFGAGEIVRKYATHNMNLIRGAARALPFTGVVVIIGAFALAGTPPFSVFFSELTILIAGFTTGRYLAASLLLVFIAVIFGGIIHHFSRILFGKKPEEMPAEAVRPVVAAPYVFLMIFIVFFGWGAPGLFRQILAAASRILQ
jgi:hydrogenase-4 component F